MAQKILIIKIGYSETFNNEISQTVSLGDIIRTTAILHLFKDDCVWWLTEEKGLPLLKDNPYIHKLLIYNLNNTLKLRKEQFDVLINLEKVPDVCVLADSITTRRKYGFGFVSKQIRAKTYDKTTKTLYITNNLELKERNKKHWLRLLYEMMGTTWKGENYILGYEPKTKEIYDVGFNLYVGNKWPDKAWSLKNWKKLELLIKDKFSYTYQQSLDNLYGYMDWINTCRLLVTNDSLGLHLCMAMEKKFIGLFGPTLNQEIQPYKKGIKLISKRRLNCWPCFGKGCIHPKKCIDYIRPEEVYENIILLLK